ncbi:hypothetical protein DINM_020217 [Dirofilaria immitis]|nr:hypothetical protein [Dirofilaria immitis]
MDNNNNNNSTVKQCIEARGIDETTITNANAIIMHVLLIMCFLSVCLQILVIINALRYIRKHVGECYMHIFLLNMTVADLLLTGIALPMEFLIDIDTTTIQFPYHVNLMMHFLLWLGTSVSGYGELVTRNRAYLMAFATWFFSVIFIYLAFHTRALICRYNCERLTTDNSRYEQKLYTANGICRKNNALKSGLRTFYFIFISTIFTILTLIPYRLVTLYRTIIDMDTVIRTCSSVFISILTYYAMDLNPILNPLLTVTILPQYRLRCLNFFIPFRFRHSSDEISDK